MPAVLSHAMPAALDSYARLGSQLYDATGSRRDRARAFVDGVRTLRDDLELPNSLAAVGGSAGDLEDLSRLCVDSERHLRASPRYLTPEDAREILETLL
jgi:alcohol dehydrogenase class IV